MLMPPQPLANDLWLSLHSTPRPVPAGLSGLGLAVALVAELLMSRPPRIWMDRGAARLNADTGWAGADDAAYETGHLLTRSGTGVESVLRYLAGQDRADNESRAQILLEGRVGAGGTFECRTIGGPGPFDVRYMFEGRLLQGGQPVARVESVRRVLRTVHRIVPAEPLYVKVPGASVNLTIARGARLEPHQMMLAALYDLTGISPHVVTVDADHWPAREYCLRQLPPALATLLRTAEAVKSPATA